MKNSEIDNRNTIKVYTDTLTVIPFKDFRDINVDNINEMCEQAEQLIKNSLPNVEYTWCFDTLSMPSFNPNWTWKQNREYQESANFKLYKDKWIDSEIYELTTPNTDCDKCLRKACYDNGDSQSSALISYIFNELTDGSPSMGCWIFPDGTYLAINFGGHNSFLDLIGEKETKFEKEWVKISGNKAYTHNNMTKQQWNTLSEFTKLYAITEAKVLWR